MPKAQQNTQVDANLDASMAARYGLSLAVLNSDPDLKNLFQRAVKETYTTDRFVAELRNTTWYKNNSDTVRSAITLKNADPATWNQRLANAKAQIARKAAAMGAAADDALLSDLAEKSMMFGWDDAQVSSVLDDNISFGDGKLFGQAAQFEQEIRANAQAQGVRLSDDTIHNYVRSAIEQGSADGAKSQIGVNAASAFPQFSDRIKAGETMADISSPYKQSMANILELNGDTLDLYDPTIRSALSSVGQDGKPAAQSLWQFELGLRKDPRWLKTKNAQDSAMSTTRTILQNMGLAY